MKHTKTKNHNIWAVVPCNHRLLLLDDFTLSSVIPFILKIRTNLHGFAMKRAVTYGADVAAERIRVDAQIEFPKSITRKI